MNEAEGHRHYATSCFNAVWGLLDKGERSEEENRLMVEMAHASLYHWLERDDCSNENLSIGFWQISRVYATVGDARQARAYADRCLRISEESSLSPFHRAYACEAAARAAILEGATDEAARFLSQSRALAGQIGDPQELELLMPDIEQLERRVRS